MPSAWAATSARADSVRAAVARTLETFGDLEIVVNNAGVSHRNRPMLEVDEAEFDRVFAVNVKSIFHMAHAAVPHLRKRGGGAIINVTSTAGIRPRPGLTWYNGSKGAANTITKSMAVELAPDKIRVCGIAPVIGADGAARDVHGRAGHAGEQGAVHRDDPLGPDEQARGHRQRGGLPRLGRGRDGHGRRPRGRWRALHLRLGEELG